MKLRTERDFFARDFFAANLFLVLTLLSFGEFKIVFQKTYFRKINDLTPFLIHQRFFLNYKKKLLFSIINFICRTIDFNTWFCITAKISHMIHSKQTECMSPLEVMRKRVLQLDAFPRKLFIVKGWKKFIS